MSVASSPPSASWQSELDVLDLLGRKSVQWFKVCYGEQELAYHVLTILRKRPDGLDTFLQRLGHEGHYIEGF